MNLESHSIFLETFNQFSLNHLINFTDAIFFFLAALQACRILVPQPGTEPGPQQWKCWVLTTRPPGNSLQFFNILNFCFYPWILSIIFITYIILLLVDLHNLLALDTWDYFLAILSTCAVKIFVHTPFSIIWIIYLG